MKHRVVVVGDVINDIVVVPRTEPRPDTDTPATIRPRAGGSGSNTAVWMGSRGVPVDFVGAVGADDAELHERAFRDAGVEPHLHVVPGMPTGAIVIIVDGEQRTMLTERGANSALRSDAVTDALLAHAAIVHVSGYSILDGFGVRGTRDVIERATAAGTQVAINAASIGAVADFGLEQFRGAIEGATVLFVNLAEAQLLSGQADPIAAARALGARHRIVATTMGSEGVLVVADGGDPIAVPAPSVRLVDPTGAGDAFAAGFLESWARDGDAVAAAEVGVFVAAAAVTTIGGRPPI